VGIRIARLAKSEASKSVLSEESTGSYTVQVEGEDRWRSNSRNARGQASG
jgi:hypothetical protein